MGQVCHSEVAIETVTMESSCYQKRSRGEMTRQDLRDALGFKNYEHFRTTYLSPATQAGLIEMTFEDKPRSWKKCYRS